MHARSISTTVFDKPILTQLALLAGRGWTRKQNNILAIDVSLEVLLHPYHTSQLLPSFLSLWLLPGWLLLLISLKTLLWALVYATLMFTGVPKHMANAFLMHVLAKNLISLPPVPALFRAGRYGMMHHTVLFWPAAWAVIIFELMPCCALCAKASRFWRAAAVKCWCLAVFMNELISFNLSSSFEHNNILDRSLATGHPAWTEAWCWEYLLSQYVLRLDGLLKGLISKVVLDFVTLHSKKSTLALEMDSPWILNGWFHLSLLMKSRSLAGSS